MHRRSIIQLKSRNVRRRSVDGVQLLVERGFDLIDELFRVQIHAFLDAGKRNKRGSLV